MKLYYNGDNISAVMESEYWISYWENGIDTEIEFIYDDYEVTEENYKLLKQLELDYTDEKNQEEIEKILLEKLHKKHFNAYEYFNENTKDIIDKVMSSVLEEYPKIKEQFEAYEEEMPEITNASELKKYIKPLRLYFKEDGDIGLGFSCWWEEEHGLGILFNQEDGVIEIGDFDVAF